MTGPTILICNDDGYFAEGIGKLKEALAPLGRVVSVAPSQDCSGVSHKITINTALRLREMEPGLYSVTGTPVDCVHLAIHGVLEGKMPDLIVSGINHGPNLGEDTAYSGTVAAAYEGYVHQIPSFAISTDWIGKKGFSFDNAQWAAYHLARAHLLDGNPFLRRAVWNINVPLGDIKGIRMVRLDRRSFKSSVVKRADPRGVPYYWIGPYIATFDCRERTDYSAFKSGFISMTPLKVEMTHFDVLENYPEEDASFTRIFESIGRSLAGERTGFHKLPDREPIGP